MLTRISVSALFAGVLGVAGCSSSSPTPEKQALEDVQTFINSNLDDLHTAVVAIQTAAPAPDADGWNATADAAAVANMKAAWMRARVAYEHVEGAIAVLFGDLDVSTDERYDAFIADGVVDPNLFDDQKVTGVHAIERILWSDLIPQRVLDFEKQLAGYSPAAFPTNQQQASDFKTKLCQRLIDDVQTMRTQFKPLALDPQTAYRGVIGSMVEQVEKANKAAGGEEESRYAQFTLADMRANVGAGLTTYNAFRPWLLQKGGAALDTQIQAGFQSIQNKYNSISGDALPAVPGTWSQTPSAEDLGTPFGQLYQLLESESDASVAGSLVAVMNQSADVLQIPRLPE
jgi:iron uptake system component EfeO